MASGHRIGWCRFRTFTSLPKVCLDSSAVDCHYPNNIVSVQSILGFTLKCQESCLLLSLQSICGYSLPWKREARPLGRIGMGEGRQSAAVDWGVELGWSLSFSGVLPCLYSSLSLWTFDFPNPPSSRAAPSPLPAYAEADTGNPLPTWYCVFSIKNWRTRRRVLIDQLCWCDLWGSPV